MLAAAAYADDPQHNEPPPELTLYWRCQSYGSLPYPGSLREQPAGLLERMQVVHNVHETWREFKRAAHHPRWINEHPEGWEIVKEVYRLRKRYA